GAPPRGARSSCAAPTAAADGASRRAQANEASPPPKASSAAESSAVEEALHDRPGPPGRPPVVLLEVLVGLGRIAQDRGHRGYFGLGGGQPVRRTAADQDRRVPDPGRQSPGGGQ